MVSVREAGQLLGVSDDTVRRWVADGRLTTHPGPGGRAVVDGEALADLAEARGRPDERGATASARNHLPGIVTRVVLDGVMAQVELQSGPHRLVSLMSREAAEQLGLRRGVVATATVKATNVVVELDGRRR